MVFVKQRGHFHLFTFGVTEFLNGFTFILAMIGMFGVSEVMRNVSSEDFAFDAVAVQTPEILYAVYVTFILANLVLIPFGIMAIKAGSQMLRVPRNMLMPAILMFCIVGSFAINN